MDEVPREAVVRRLLALDDETRLGTVDVRLAAEGLGVSERTVWRWVEQAHAETVLRSRRRFEVSDEVRERLAFWRGNVAAVHRELVAAEKAGGRVAPSRPTLQRAVQRDLLRGDRAGLREVLEGRTPLQAWLEDPTPISTVPSGDLRLLMLEDDGRTRRITTKGVKWRARWYVGTSWMTGQAGREVRLRHMPHHEHEIEVFDAGTGEHLGPAILAAQASAEQIGELRRAREARKRQLQADLRAAERTRRVRYAAATAAGPVQPVTAAAGPVQPVTAVTAAQAASELGDVDARQLQAVARPALMPLGPPEPGWVLPKAPPPRVRPAADPELEGGVSPA